MIPPHRAANQVKTNRACAWCHHPDLHILVADSGDGWPKKVLGCTSCPDGRCVIPPDHTHDECVSVGYWLHVAHTHEGQTGHWAFPTEVEDLVP